MPVHAGWSFSLTISISARFSRTGRLASRASSKSARKTFSRLPSAIWSFAPCTLAARTWKQAPWSPWTRTDTGFGFCQFSRSDFLDTGEFDPSGLTLGQYEQEIIREALRRADSNKSQAARMLGLTRNALRYRLAQMALET
jgi:hypothetical protein